MIAPRLHYFLAASALLVSLAALTACGPNYNAISNRLRMQTMAQDRQISDLKEKLAARDASIQTLNARLDNQLPRVETLPADRLASLFTAAKIEIQKSTDISDLDSGNSTPKGFRVYIRTLTDDGMVFPATGTLVIEAFQLPAAPAPPVRLGSWTFTPAEMKKSWYGGFGLNHFAFNCPWTTAPSTSQKEVLFTATFTDALTGNVLKAQLNKTLQLPR